MFEYRCGSSVLDRRPSFSVCPHVEWHDSLPISSDCLKNNVMLMFFDWIFCASPHSFFDWLFSSSHEFHHLWFRSIASIVSFRSSRSRMLPWHSLTWSFQGSPIKSVSLVDDSLATQAERSKPSWKIWYLIWSLSNLLYNPLAGLKGRNHP